ncbi:MAG: hypothetical protein M0Z75_03465 [Nitrospiraceae bacterium]|nr:hypothetical protein [Nitrospiraceae bacterium]MDA8090115.1 hypothetical protein [Nitrospiraceae bacterium]
MKAKKEVKVAGGKDFQDISEDIDTQIVYLTEIAGLLRYLFEGKTTAIIPLSNVLDDLCGRLEHLKASIGELKVFYRK